MNERRLRKRTTWFGPAILGVLVSTAMDAGAVSGTTQVAWWHKPVVARSDWPEGAVGLVNDPLRTEGWNPWFSEWPNDVNYYAFRVESTNDVNRLIAKLAPIKCPKVQVRLSPEPEARALAFTTVLKERNGAAVVFSIGSQKRLDEWYQHLREEEPGARVFGVHRLREPPKALPPTLTLYAGNEAMDLKSLKIPSAVEVSALVTPADRKEAKNTPLIKAIDDFVAKRQNKAATPAQGQPAPQTATNPPAVQPMSDPSGGQKPPTHSRCTAIPPSDEEHVAWVGRCLGDFASIKPGMTRQEVERKFNLDGGLQSTSPVRFCLPACPYFKVDVRFEFKRDPTQQGRAITAKDYKVIRVSKPYLEAPFMD